MNATKRIVLVTLLSVLGLFPLAWASGQIYDELALFDLILGIIETPDPISHVHCTSLFADPSSDEDRGNGERHDGRPEFEFDRATTAPYLTWAYDAGTAHDIAFNAWNGTGWDPKIEFVASTAADELDPRLFVDRYNTAFIIWWENTLQSRIMLSKRDGSGTWTPPSMVATGRRPSVAVWQDDLVVAYERTLGAYTEVVFARSYRGGPFVGTTIALVSRSGRLDPIVHVHGGEMWIDWKQTDTSLGYSTYQDGTWKPLRLQPWSDPSWFGELVARHQIELTVLR